MDKFVKRIETLLDYYAINASSFADRIGVQRSSLSHLLSGRNKPSLDFVMKIIEEFPDVDLYWILQGKGSFPKKNETYKPTNPILKEKNVIENNPAREIKSNVNTIADLFNSAITEEKVVSKNEPISNPVQKDDLSIPTNNSISKIIIFYKDGTFEDFNPRL